MKLFLSSCLHSRERFLCRLWRCETIVATWWTRLWFRRSGRWWSDCLRSVDETIRHRLTTLDLYRKSLGDALSDAMQSKNVALIDNLASNHAVPIFFYDYIEAACHSSAARMIGKLTVEQWKRQASATIDEHQRQWCARRSLRTGWN